MAVRSIIDIELQTAAWEKYQREFDRYSEGVRKQPEIWKKIQAEHAKLAQGFATLGNATEKHLEALESTASALDQEHALLQENELLSRSTSTAWKETAGHSGTFVRNLGTAVTTASKWGALMFGAAAFGTVSGIDRLANDAAGQRQAAMGLGTGIGQLRAFATNFARIGDIGGLLAQTNAMETDISKQVPWRALGLGAMSGNAVTDAMRYLDAIRAFAQRTPLDQLGIRAAAFGIDVDAETLRRIRATSPQEWAQIEQGTLADVNRMNVPGAKSLQDLSTQLSRNLATIGAAFETQLGRAAPALTKLSAAATAASVHLINLTGNTIAKDLSGFSSHPWGSLGNLGKSAINAFDWLVGTGAPTFGPGGAVEQYESDFHAFSAKALWQKLLTYGQGVAARFDAAQRSKYFGLANQLDPSGMLGIIGAIESNMSPNARDSSAGAIGMMQFMPGVAASLGVNPRDPLDSLYGANTLLQRLEREYGGDIDKTAAAYNWGEGRLNADIAKYGDEWRSHLPAETSDYLKKVDLMLMLRQLQLILTGSTKVDVKLPPGSSATASISGLGASR